MQTLAVVGFLLLVVVMVILVAAGAHQFLSVLVPLAVFPALVFIGSKRKMARRISKPK